MNAKKYTRSSIAAAAVLCLTVLLSSCASKQAAVQASAASPTPSASASVSATPSPSESPSPSAVYSPSAMPSPASPSPSAAKSGKSIVYENTKYGFTFTLPADWKGYSIVTEKWQGWSVSDANKILAEGTKLSIRNPKWTKTTPTQDIPIMVFTLSQWADLEKEKFSVSAAPIPPEELGRNSAYVFALPARYNFSYLPGFEEVDQIIQGKPLQTNNNFK